MGKSVGNRGIVTSRGGVRGKQPQSQEDILLKRFVGVLIKKPGDKVEWRFEG